MNSMEIIALVVSAVGVVSFAAIFTLLYRSYANSVITEVDNGQNDVELIEETIYENYKNTKISRRIFKKVKQVLFYVLIILLVPLMAIAIVSKFRDGVVMIGGRGVIAVASGSMSEKHPDNAYLAGLDDQIPTYDMIVIERVSSPTDLKKYDTIAYKNDEGVNIIHRIVNIEYTADGTKFTTRGDSNNADDKYKPTIDDVIGRYTGKSIPFVGLFVMFLQSYSGIVTIAAVIYCLLMIEWVGDKIYKARMARLMILQDSIDFKKETEAKGDITSSFVETIRFRNIIYTFDENGFVDKTVLDDDELAAEADSDNGEQINDSETPPDEVR